MLRTAFLFPLAATLCAQPYDLLIKGGHVIDPKNNINRVMDVAISGGKIAAVSANIAESEARRVADAKGLYVTPGLIDIHVHVYAGTGKPRVYTGDLSVYPDNFSFRTGVTTMVDAGTAGWRNFPDFHDRVIKRARTRVLAFLNIVGGGMGPDGESNPADMDADATVKMAKANPSVIIGIKTAHYSGKGWPAVDGAAKSGRELNLPVMVDFGSINEERNLNTLFMDKLRPGDIYTHCYSGLRDEVLNGKLNPAMTAGRKRGIFFDVGHGGGSFFWPIAVKAYEAGFVPDSISTDLHTGSMNAGMKEMANVMSKILNLGTPLDQVIRMSTWNPANEIKHPELGHLTVGSEADVAILRHETGDFGFTDSAGARRKGSQRLSAEITVRAGQVMWDLNGRASQDWEKFQYRTRARRPAAPKP
ncbi:MAG TPA: amidohydrolase/deacetylase family metallohydrolase [Bryobacteraceae bacterium]|nr:amidohydrolase/deacetylase family metallohydrolase [Bryobacteraceae bacterium]